MDGPMGTRLGHHGVSTDGIAWSAEALRTAPELVARVHAEYAAAGDWIPDRSPG